jgi:hypothetical protein
VSWVCSKDDNGTQHVACNGTVPGTSPSNVSRAEVPAANGEPEVCATSSRCSGGQPIPVPCGSEGVQGVTMVSGVITQFIVNVCCVDTD